MCMAISFEISPSIGIARVGSSGNFFLAPEPGLAPPNSYRDGNGLLLRQAARFRIFRCDRDATGQITSFDEITAAQAKIHWKVQVVNRKADVPKFLGGGLRNAGEVNRARLVIDPGPRSLNGPNQSANFDGQFRGEPVGLGYARTDGDARLIVAGGAGRSGGVRAAGPAAVPITNFADNDDWFDDVADGPIEASITLNGAATATAVKPAWIIVGPPDFAPPIRNFVTLYDVILQVAIDRGFLTIPARPSFAHDIQPILASATGYQWVNDEAMNGHGPGASGDFAARWAQLSNPATPIFVRQSILNRLRNPNSPPPPLSQAMMPRLHDDTNTAQVLQLPPFRYAQMEQWVAGNFDNDLGAPDNTPLPDLLTKVALEATAGGAFYPGIEAGRVLRRPEIYAEAFRIALDQIRPGDVTGQNAVPWQADFAACSWESQLRLAWWPGQRPDHVRTDFDALISEAWDRGVSDGRAMVDSWDKLGVVVPQPHPVTNEIQFLERERTLP